MLKNKIAIVGLGLAGETVAYQFQQKNYPTYLINGSEQDNNTLPDAKNVMVLEGYDGLAGDRKLAFDALSKNKTILEKLARIEQDIVVCIASGGGTTGSGSIPYAVDSLLASNPNRIVVIVILMPRRDEAIQKRINAYDTIKELMEIEELGAMILVNNESRDDLSRINSALVGMLDTFFSDEASSSGSNFDDSEKMKMLKESGMFIIAKLTDQKGENQRTRTQDIINVLTAKNIFLPINNDGIVGNIGIINQTGNKMDEHEIEKAVGTPENIFIGNKGASNLVCVSGLSFPTEYISKMGQEAVKEQKERLSRRKSLTLLDDLDEAVAPEKPVKKSKSGRRTISLDMLRDM